MFYQSCLLRKLYLLITYPEVHPSVFFYFIPGYFFSKKILDLPKNLFKPYEIIADRGKLCQEHLQPATENGKGKYQFPGRVAEYYARLHYGYAQAAEIKKPGGV